MQESESGSDEAVTFSRELSAMKRRGSNILVVGAGVSDAHVAACRRLLGEAGHRRRLFVFTDDGHGIGRRCVSSERDTSTVRIVDCSGTTRSAASTTQPSPSGPAVSHTDAPIDDLAVLGNAVAGGIDYFEAESDGLEPAELRLCVASLCPLLAENDDRSVFRFLHALTSDVRRVSGMGHYHLAVPHGAEEVSVLAPIFDAVVEVRTRDEHEQRWHLQDPEFTTDWLTL